jgi:hypothetical protein
MVKVRADFFLEPGDARYDETYYLWQVEPDHPSYTPYLGKRDANGIAIDKVAYKTWWESLPKEYIHAPFHCALFYVEPEVSDDDILKEAENRCKDAYKAWKENNPIKIKEKEIKWPKIKNQDKINACNNKIFYLKKTPLEKKVKE